MRLNNKQSFYESFKEKLNESYAIVNYYNENGEQLEKIINGKSPKEVEAKVKRLNDKYEIIDIHQASADVADSKYLDSLGKGVLRKDYNNKTFKESDKLNEYGDVKDYSSDIETLFKKWFKKNADLFTRAIQSISSSYDLDIVEKESGSGADKKKIYKVTNKSPFIEVEDYADEIGEFISDNIPGLKFEESNYDNKDENITWIFSQQLGMPDFGDNIY